MLVVKLEGISSNQVYHYFNELLALHRDLKEAQPGIEDRAA